MTLEAIRDKLFANDVAFIHDPDGNVHYWKLRALPAITYLGVEHATYPTSWRQLSHTWEYERGGTQYDFPGATYHVVGDEGIDLPRSEDLCVVTTSYYEHQTQYSVEKLVDRYTQASGTLVVVADERRFEPEGSLRPLHHEQFVDRVGSYDRVFGAFEDHYRAEGWELPLRDTSNLFVQDNAVLYEFVENERITTVESLFEVLPEAPYLPLYRVFSDVFARKDEHGTSPLESESMIDGLGGWLRRRIELERGPARDIASELNERVATEGRVFDPAAARRSPKMQDAREAADRLDPAASDIDRRYNEWLHEDPI